MMKADIEYAVKNRVGIVPDDLTSADLREAGCWDRVCVLPEDFNERVSYLADTLVQMLTRCKSADERLRGTVGQMCQALSYTVNSASWRDGTLHDFDLDELRLKLRRFGGITDEQR